MSSFATITDKHTCSTCGAVISSPRAVRFGTDGWYSYFGRIIDGISRPDLSTLDLSDYTRLDAATCVACGAEFSDYPSTVVEDDSSAPASLLIEEVRQLAEAIHAAWLAQEQEGKPLPADFGWAVERLRTVTDAEYAEAAYGA